jgi:hypothetical protein
LQGLSCAGGCTPWCHHMSRLLLAVRAAVLLAGGRGRLVQHGE